MGEFRPRLLQDFIIPHLNRGTFGDRLRWVDKTQKKFQISWTHQSSSRYSAEDGCVFKAWAEAKRLWDPLNNKKYTVAKQRFRAALLKLRRVRLLHKGNGLRIYQLCNQDGSSNQESSESSSDPFEENSQNFEFHSFVTQSLSFVDTLSNSVEIHPFMQQIPPVSVEISPTFMQDSEYDPEDYATDIFIDRLLSPSRYEDR